jgi:hypothetical protein
MEELSLTVMNNEYYSHDILCITKSMSIGGEQMRHSGGPE